MASLSSQLAQLRGDAAHTAPAVAALAKNRKVVSFLFEPKQAAELDRHAIHTLAIGGLAELRVSDERIGAYEKTLFSAAAKDFDRDLQTNDVIAKLNVSIASFLRLLSPYFMLRAAHKTVEFLIRRYRIHEHNVDDIMECMLPYHETAFFPRMVQLLSLSKSRWRWLEPMQKTPNVLQRTDLVARMVQDPTLVTFIAGIAQKSVEAGIRHKTAISFYGVVMVEYVKRLEKISEEAIHRLLPALQSGLKSQNAEYQSASFMVMTAICSRATLTSAMTTAILDLMCKHCNESTAMNAVTTLVFICQTQNVGVFPANPFKFLVKIPDFVDITASVCTRYNGAPFLSAMLPQLAHHSLRHNNYMNILRSVVQKVNITAHADAVVQTMLAIISGQSVVEGVDRDTDAVQERVRDVLRLVESRYPKETDAGINAAMAEAAKGGPGLARLKTFVTEAFGGGVHAPLSSGEGTLFMSLRHASASVRRAALKELSTQTETLKDDPSVGEAVLERVMDDDENLAVFTLKSKPLLDTVEPSALLEALSSIISTPGKSKHVVRQALRVLGGDLLKQHPEFSAKVAPVIVGAALNLPLSTKQTLLAIKYLSNLADYPLVSGISKLDTKSAKAKSEGESKEDKEAERRAARELYGAMLDVFSANMAKKPSNLLQTYAELKSHVSPSSRLGLLVAMCRAAASADKKNAFAICEAIAAECVEGINSLGLDAIKAAENQETPSIPLTNSPLPTSFIESLEKVCNQAGQSGLSPVMVASVLNALLRAMPASSDKDQDNAHMSIITDIMSTLFYCPRPKIFNEHLMMIFAGHIKSDLFGVLSQIWCGDQVHPSRVQCHALSTALALMEAVGCAATGVAGKEAYADFHVMLPSLCVAASSPFKEVRKIALDIFTKMEIIGMKAGAFSGVASPQKAKSKGGHVYSKAKLYGAAADFGVDAALTYKFAEAVCSCKEEIAADGSQLRVLLKRLLARSSKSDVKMNDKDADLIVCALLSGAEGLGTSRALISVLSALRDVKSVTKLGLVLEQIKGCVSRGLEGRTAEDAVLLPLLLDDINSEMASEWQASPKVARAAMETLLQVLAATAVYEVDGQKHSCAAEGLKRLTPNFIAALTPEERQSLFHGACKLLISTDIQLQTSAKETLIAAPLESAIFTQYLVDIGFPDAGVTVAQNKTPKKKARRDSGRTAEGEAEVAGIDVNALTAVLELMLVKDDIPKKTTLMAPLFGVLSALCDADAVEPEGGESLAAAEYTKQVLLSVLENIAIIMKNAGVLADTASKKRTPKKAPAPAGLDSFDVELVVEIVRSTNVPQTRNAAMLLLCSAASLAPKRLLGSIVPVFALMGRNNVNRDDNNSFHVVQQMLERVVPLMVENEGLGVRELVTVFADSVDAIPTYRRLRLFLILTQAMSEKYVPAMLAMLLRRYAGELTRGKSRDGDVDMDQQEAAYDDTAMLPMLCHQLAMHSSVSSQCHMFVTFLKVVSDLIRNKEDGQQASLGDTYFVDADVNKRATQNSILVLLQFIAGHLQSRPFLQQVIYLDSKDESEVNNVQKEYLSIFEDVLSLWSTLGDVKKSHTQEVRGFLQSLQPHLMTLLERVNNLTTVEAFLSMIGALLHHADANIRKKALLLFNDKMEKSADLLDPSMGTEFANIVKDVSEILTSTNNSGEEVAANKQVALISLDMMARSFAAHHTEMYVETIPAVIHTMEDSCLQVVGNSLIVLSTLCEALGTEVLPHLPKFVPLVLSILRDSSHLVYQPNEQDTADDVTQKTSDVSALLMISALNTVDIVVRQLPQFLSPFIPEILSVVLSEKLLEVPDGKVAEVLEGMAAGVPARTMLPPIFSSYKPAEMPTRTIVTLFRLLGQVCSNMDKESMMGHYKKVFKFFLGVFEYRRLHKGKDVAEVEQSAISAFLDLVMKMSDPQFRPLFVKLFDWMSSSEFGTPLTSQRVVTFYALARALSDRLKGVFVNFVGYFLDHSVNIFVELAKRDDGDAGALLFKSTKKRKTESADKNTDDDSYILVTSALATFTNCFRYDTNDYFTQEKYDKLLEPLVNQLDTVSRANYQTMVTDYLVPCLGQLAGSMSKEEQWKPLNYKVMLKTRSQSASVRFAALTVMQELYARLGEEFLVFLPEQIPFLSELMEDDSEDVEKLLQQLIQTIEGLSGESIQKYFGS